MTKNETPPQPEDKDQETRKFVLPDLMKDLAEHSDSDPDEMETSLDLEPVKTDPTYMLFPDDLPILLEEEEDNG